jgi:hypothetical protein
MHANHRGCPAMAASCANPDSATGYRDKIHGIRAHLTQLNLRLVRGVTASMNMIRSTLCTSKRCLLGRIELSQEHPVSSAVPSVKFLITSRLQGTFVVSTFNRPLQCRGIRHVWQDVRKLRSLSGCTESLFCCRLKSLDVKLRSMDSGAGREKKSTK